MIRNIYKKVKDCEEYFDTIKNNGYLQCNKSSTIIKSTLKTLLDDIMDSPSHELLEFKESGLKEFTKHLEEFFGHYNISIFFDILSIDNNTSCYITLFTDPETQTNKELIIEFLICILLDNSKRYTINCDMMPQCSNAYFLERSIIDYFLYKSGMIVFVS